MKFGLTLLLLGALTCFGQRGLNTRAAVTVPPIVPMVTLSWTPNPLAIQTVIDGNTDLSTTNWQFCAAVLNDITNVYSEPKTNAVKFYRAYSE